MNDWRVALYSLGYIANLLFALRFFAQWISSEQKKKSELPAFFWRISLSANCAMFIHTLIQLQFNICLIQVINGTLSWRNLNLMKPKEKQLRFSTVCTLLGTGILGTLALFTLQGIFFYGGELYFFGTPGAKLTEVSAGWHLLGTFSYTLFSSRFWLQWWQSECAKKSTVKSSFWILSLGGALLSSTYFYLQGDTVNFIGPALGMIPYLRNLILTLRAPEQAAT